MPNSNADVVAGGGGRPPFIQPDLEGKLLESMAAGGELLAEDMTEIAEQLKKYQAIQFLLERIKSLPPTQEGLSCLSLEDRSLLYEIGNILLERDAMQNPLSIEAIRESRRPTESSLRLTLSELLEFVRGRADEVIQERVRTRPMLPYVDSGRRP